MKKVNKDNCKKPFGEKVVVLGGDFRQILSVVRKGPRAAIVKATICSSKIWKDCKVLKLTKNMRLTGDTTNQSRNELKHFANWILKIGDGLLNAYENGEAHIQIPEELCILHGENPLLSLVDFVYPYIVRNIANANYFED